MPFRIISWLLELPGKLKGKNTEEVKLIISEVKDLRDYYKSEFKEQLAIMKEQTTQIQSLQEQISVNTMQMANLQQMEERCLRQNVELQQLYRDVLEKLIFKTRGRHKDDEIL
jgi:isochorismate hydrolase